MSKKKRQETIKIELDEFDSRTIEFGNGISFSIMKTQNSYITHLNLGRYTKKGNIKTYTKYDSIMDNDKANGEVWIDKQSKKLIGVETFWSEKCKKSLK